MDGQSERAQEPECPSRVEDSAPSICCLLNRCLSGDDLQDDARLVSRAAQNPANCSLDTTRSPDGCSRLGVVVVVTAQERVGHQIDVEGSLELVGQVPVGDPSQDRPTFVGQARIPCPSAPTALLSDVHTSHRPHSGSEGPLRNSAVTWEGDVTLPGRRGVAIR